MSILAVTHRIFSCGMWYYLVPWSGNEPARPPALGVWGPSHWPTREVPGLFFEILGSKGHIGVQISKKGLRTINANTCSGKIKITQNQDVLVLSEKNTCKIIRNCPNPKVGIINNVTKLKGRKDRQKLKSFIKQNIVPLTFIFLHIYLKSNLLVKAKLN